MKTISIQVTWEETVAYDRTFDVEVPDDFATEDHGNAVFDLALSCILQNDNEAYVTGVVGRDLDYWRVLK